MLRDVYVRVCSKRNGCITLNACPLLDDVMQPSRKPRPEKNDGTRDGGSVTKKWKNGERARGHRGTDDDDESRTDDGGLKHFYSFFVSTFLAQPSHRLRGIVSWPLAQLNPGWPGALSPGLSSRCLLFSGPLLSLSLSLSRNYFSPRTGETRTVSEIGQTSVLTKYKLLDRK